MTVAILDVDGTLVDTNYQHALAWYRAFRDHGIVLPIWRVHRHIGMGGDQLVQALTDEDTERRLGDEIRESEGEHYSQMIGDSPWDARAAERAGVQTLAVMTGGFSREELREAGAVEVYESLPELEDALGQGTLSGARSS